MRLPLVFLALRAGFAVRPLKEDHASALQASARVSSASKRKHGKYIWAFFEYPTGPGPWVELTMRTWQKHAPDWEIMRVNDSNIKWYVPDLPDEFYRVPYNAAKSDIVRASVLYHHGGVYMDTDFMLMRDLSPVEELLKTGDVVGYRSEGFPDLGANRCGDDFSSNFMAANAHNKFSETWWKNIKLKLTRACGPEEYFFEKVCCHEEGNQTRDKDPCHLPWAQLEHIKLPSKDHDLQGNPIDPTQLKKHRNFTRRFLQAGADPPFQLAGDTVMKCLAGSEGFAPHINGEVYWQPWDRKAQATLPLGDAQAEGGYYDERFACIEVKDKEDDLICKRGNWGEVERRFSNFFHRIAYHLFFSTKQPDVKSVEEALESDWLLSEMFRRSLGLSRGG